MTTTNRRRRRRPCITIQRDSDIYYEQTGLFHTFCVILNEKHVTLIGNKQKCKSYAFLMYVEKPLTTTISCIFLIRIRKKPDISNEPRLHNKPSHRTDAPEWRAININPFLFFSVSLWPVLTLPRGQWPSTVQPPFGTSVVNNYYTNKTVGARTCLVFVRVSPVTVFTLIPGLINILGYFSEVFPDFSRLPKLTSDLRLSNWDITISSDCKKTICCLARTNFKYYEHESWRENVLFYS